MPKEVKGKEGESTCKLASGPVAKFISQMRRIEPCTPASKTKGKQMMVNPNQLHRELRRLWDGKGQVHAVSAQISTRVTLTQQSVRPASWAILSFRDGNPPLWSQEVRQEHWGIAQSSKSCLYVAIIQVSFYTF